MGSLDSKQVLGWVQAARAGDEEALRELIGAAMEFLFPATLAMLGERQRRGTYLSDTLHNAGSDLAERMHDDAWAITHAACCRMATSLDSFRGKGLLGRRVQFSTWLYAIARNEMRNLMRSRWREAKRRRGTLPERDETPETDPLEALAATASDEVRTASHGLSPEEAVEREADRRLVRQALDEAPLTEEQREAILLYYGLGYTQERIARLTGVQVGTVKKRLFDGLRKLRHYVQERSDASPNRERRA